jgi:hypothetical protein
MSRRMLKTNTQREAAALVTVCMVMLSLLMLIGCGKSGQTTQPEFSRFIAIGYSKFFVPREGEFCVPLSSDQTRAVSNLIVRLHKEGRWSDVDAPAQWGTFWIEGSWCRWNDYLIFAPSGRDGCAYFSDHVISNLAERVRSSGKDLHDFGSNDWANALSAIERK